MQKVFISYRREDSIDVAGRIYDWLAARLPEDSVFIDVDSILAGADFREALEKTLDQAGAVLAIIGRRWLDVTDSSGRRRLDNPEDFVRVEIETAMQRKIPVVPILVQGSEMPSAQQVPESLAPFVYRNALPVRPNPDFNNDMGRVARVLESYVPELAIASAPIPGHGPTVTRGAPLSGTQAPTAGERQPGSPVVPAGWAVRSIHYPWMVGLLLLAHLFEALGVAPQVSSLEYPGAGVISPILIPALFYASAFVLLTYMLVRALTTLNMQHRTIWFGSLLGISAIGVLITASEFRFRASEFFPTTLVLAPGARPELIVLFLLLVPYLGLWAYALFGPTTPAPQNPDNLAG